MIPMTLDAPLLAGPLATGPGAPSRQTQLTQRLKQAILAGELPAGGKLPSSRGLSESLGVARNTVLIAYEQLAAEGFVVADTQGTRVAALQGRPVARPKPVPAAQAPTQTAQRLSRLQPTRGGAPGPLPLAPGIPALAQFPLAAWRRAHEQVLKAALPATLAYGDPLGEPVLREALARHLRASRGVRCEPAQVIVTEGAQEALALCVRLLTNPGDTVWLEDPGYRGARAAFNAGDLKLVPMRVDAQGLQVPTQAWREAPPRLIQATPAHQYPTGAVLSVARRLDLLQRAAEAGAWIVEDDYDSEFRHQGEPIAAMQGLRPDAPVLYIGTFSKTMFPALRLGFLVLPAALQDAAASPMAELLRGGHRLEQLAMARFIETGQFARHLGRMRRLYRERQQALREALATQLGVAHEVLGGQGGLHLTVRLAAALRDQAIVDEARRQGLGVAALSSYAMQPRPEDNGLVIGYGNTSAEQMGPMVKRLGRIAKAQAGKAAG
ncbi:PLP-dependent aminotransferase family protein [Ideonella azotifigens]|uniref:PLP-dependent aminotransferase family protein n=4 Tax=Ideonella azotifigens TaxID=513160 RepID=A0ABP3USI7_9BURK